MVWVRATDEWQECTTGALRMQTKVAGSHEDWQCYTVAIDLYSVIKASILEEWSRASKLESARRPDSFAKVRSD